MHSIIQINVTANWGSTGKIAEECNSYVSQRGWNCHYAYGRYANPSKSHLHKIGTKFNVYEHYLESKLLANEGLASRIATKKLIKEIKHIKPDIVHIHNIHDHWLNYKILFKYLNGTDIKVVWTFHDFWAITGYCSHFVRSNCQKWKDGCEKCPKIKDRLFPLHDKSKQQYSLKKTLFTSNNNLHIVAVSDWVECIAKQSFLNNKSISTIYNGIDCSVFRPTQPTPDQVKSLWPIIGQKFMILAVSSQWKDDGKGLADYIKMSKMLSNDEIIVLVGVPDSLTNSLPKNILGVKRTNCTNELAALYSRADVVTSFSSAETFGLTIVEGFACGTPAIVYNNTAQPYLITPDTGYVVPDRSYEEAYEAIQIIKKVGKNHFSEACIALAREKYDISRCLKQYYNLYNTLIDESHI